MLQTFAGARDNDGQGVVCILQGTQRRGQQHSLRSCWASGADPVERVWSNVSGILMMFGGLAGSFWWVMLAYTVFQFLVFELASDRARRAVRAHLASPRVP